MIKTLLTTERQARVDKSHRPQHSYTLEIQHKSEETCDCQWGPFTVSYNETNSTACHCVTTDILPVSEPFLWTGLNCSFFGVLASVWLIKEAPMHNVFSIKLPVMCRHVCCIFHPTFFINETAQLGVVLILSQDHSISVSHISCPLVEVSLIPRKLTGVLS